MPDPQTPPTLTYLAGQVSGVWCWCETCNHSGVLELAALITRFGGSSPFPSVRQHLRCGACGSREVFARPNWHDPDAVAQQ